MKGIPVKTAAILIDRKNVPDGFDVSGMLSATVDKIKRLTDDIFFLTDSDSAPDGTEPLQVSTSNQLLRFMGKRFTGTQVLILNAYSPLIDLESTRKMLDEQERLVFDYTYPENLPFGLIPEVMVGDIASIIEKTLPQNIPLFVRSVRDLFESDISSYDTNIFIHPTRLGLYRTDFIPNNLNNALITQAIMERLGVDLTIDELEEAIRRNPELIRGKPTFYEIRIHSDREAGELFASHRIKNEGTMPVERVKSLLERIAEFSYDPVVMFGFYGEPFLHPRIGEIIDLLKNYPNIRFLFESRGFLTDFKPVERALKSENVSVLFDISFTDEKQYTRYKKPYQAPYPFETLSAQEEKIKALKPAERVYPQLTRFNENEAQIGRFYEIWKDYQDRIVIKKPDTFGGELKSQVVIDLAPVKRHFCYHLKHDMLILPDGTVALNRHDLDGKRSVGNVFDDGLDGCWNRLGELYIRQWQNDFQDLENTCDCDDWWVFNF